MPFPILTQKGIDGAVVIIFLCAMAGIVLAILANEQAVPSEILPGSESNLDVLRGDFDTSTLPVYTGGVGVTVTDKTIKLEQVAGPRFIVNTTSESAAPFPSKRMLPNELLLGGGRSSLLEPTNEKINLLTSVAGTPEWTPYIPESRPFPFPLAAINFSGGTGFLLGYLESTGVAVPFQFDPQGSPLAAGVKVTFQVTTTVVGAAATFSVDLNHAIPNGYHQINGTYQTSEVFCAVEGDQTLSGSGTHIASGQLVVNLRVFDGEDEVGTDSLITGTFTSPMSISIASPSLATKTPVEGSGILPKSTLAPTTTSAVPPQTNTDTPFSIAQDINHVNGSFVGPPTPPPPPYIVKFLGVFIPFSIVALVLGVVALVIQAQIANNTVNYETPGDSYGGYTISDGLTVENENELGLEQIFRQSYFGTRSQLSNFPGAVGPLGDNEMLFGTNTHVPAGDPGTVLLHTGTKIGFSDPPFLPKTIAVLSDLITPVSGWCGTSGSFSRDTMLAFTSIPLDLSSLAIGDVTSWSFTLSSIRGIQAIGEDDDHGVFRVSLISLIPNFMVRVSGQTQLAGSGGLVSQGRRVVASFIGDPDTSFGAPPGAELTISIKQEYVQVDMYASPLAFTINGNILLQYTGY